MGNSRLIYFRVWEGLTEQFLQAMLRKDHEELNEILGSLNFDVVAVVQVSTPAKKTGTLNEDNDNTSLYKGRKFTKDFFKGVEPFFWTSDRIAEISLQKPDKVK